MPYFGTRLHQCRLSDAISRLIALTLHSKFGGRQVWTSLAPSVTQGGSSHLELTSLSRGFLVRGVGASCFKRDRRLADRDHRHLRTSEVGGKWFKLRMTLSQWQFWLALRFCRGAIPASGEWSAP